MSSDVLILKEKRISDKDVVFTFHKDVYWLFNEDPCPVVIYTLKNCRNLNEIDLSSIDFYNDGIVLEIKQDGQDFVLEMTDLGNRKTAIFCDKIDMEEQEYSSTDYIYLLKEFARQRDESTNDFNNLNKRIEGLNQFLNHELESINRKINEAAWLKEDKKRFLEGRLDAIKTMIEKLDEKAG